MHLRLDLADADTPLRGCRRLQHLPRRGATLAHRLDEVARAARAVGVLVAVGLLVTRRLHHVHAGPVGAHLVGKHHRQAGARRARAHLGTRRDDIDNAVLADRHEDLGIVDDAVRHRAGAGGITRGQGASDAGQLGGKHQPAGCGHAFEEIAPADVGDRDLAVCAELCHVTLLSQPRERPCEYADSSRSGTDCRPCRRGFAGLSAPASWTAAPRPA